MVCIHCGGKTQVINSRPQERSNQIWRRRQCLGCKAVFTTSEAADYSAAWVVLQVAGTIQPFSRDKLFMSMFDSVQHRQTALLDAGALTGTIIQKIQQTKPGAAIEARTITQTAQVALNRFDSAASVHYAAFHKPNY